MPESEPSRKKIFCNHCRRRTNHVLKGSHINRIPDEDEGLFEEYVFRLWVCAGCEFATMEQQYLLTALDPDDDRHQFDDEDYEFDYYPPRAFQHRKVKQFSKFPDKLMRIYKEAISCFNVSASVLCAAGLRSLLEGICQDKKIKGRNLEERIDNLEFLLPNKNIIRHLHHFRFTGNRAMHELEAPDAEHVALALDVIEDLMSYLYELDYKASKLKLKRSRRRVCRSKQQEAVVASAIVEAVKVN